MRKLQDELQFERGVVYALQEVSRGEKLEDLAAKSGARYSALVIKIKALKDRYGTK